MEVLEVSYLLSRRLVELVTLVDSSMSRFDSQEDARRITGKQRSRQRGKYPEMVAQVRGGHRIVTRPTRATTLGLGALSDETEGLAFDSA